MSRPSGIEQRYYDHFKQGSGWGKEDQGRYDNYMKATKGLDKELAWKALDGGQSFDTKGGDMQRYNALVKERDAGSAAKAKEKAQAHQEQTKPAPKPEPQPAPKSEPQSTSKQQSNTSNYDYGSYVKNNQDLEDWWADSTQEGMHQGGGVYEQNYGRKTKGWEKGWLKGMNEKYGTNNTDVGQFTKEQFGQYHYDKFGKNEGRKLSGFAEAKEKAQGNKTVSNSGNTDIKDSFNNRQETKNTQEQTVTQDNDINQTMGNNNIVTNNVDNSVRQYGGDNRSMVINTNGKGSLTKQLDGAATAATLGGFYDVDDSPAANASFVDRYNVMNKDMQKGFKSPQDFTNKAIAMADKFTQMDANRFDQRIQARQRKNEARSRLMFNDIFGDPSKKTADWQRPDTPSVPEEPDWDDMYGKMTDF